MEIYLPDTNIFVYAYNGEEPYATKLFTWITEKSLIISAIVAAEFLSGGEEIERYKFETLIDRFGTIAVDTTIVKVAASYKRQFSKLKPKFKLPDCLIAATVKIYSATLVSFNPTDFPMTDIKKIQI